MRSLARLRPSPPLIVAFLALVVAITGVGLASIPGAGGVVRACYDKQSGELRVVNTTRRHPRGRCRKGEKALAWNQVGRPGANGRDGINGANGANGSSGLPTVVIRFADFTADANKQSGHVHIQCQPGERATGGGIGWSGSPGSGDAVLYSGPEDANFSQNAFPAQGATPTGWAGEIRTSDNPGKPGRVYAICASP